MRVQFSAGADRLTRAYPKLSPQLKKCAAYILEHPSEVATLSMRQVAARADVPPSTMNRLARALGFNAYNEFRDIYRNSINDIPAGWSQGDGELPATVEEAEFDHGLGTFQHAATQNLNAMFDQIDRKALDRAVQALADARRVFVMGMYESHSAANYFHCIGATGFPHWQLVNRHNGELACLLEPLTEADVVVAIALEPWAIDTINVARHARKCGARVVGITDLRTSPLAACSHDILLVPIQGPSVFQSYVAVTALLEVLAGMVVAHSGQSVIEKMDHLEHRRREIGVYWPK